MEKAVDKAAGQRYDNCTTVTCCNTEESCHAHRKDKGPSIQGISVS